MSCPICEKDTNPRYRPFCSKRCADVDLGKWLSEGYTIPGSATEEEDGMSSDFSERPPKIH